MRPAGGGTPTRAVHQVVPSRVLNCTPATGQYTQVPNSFIRDPRIDPTDKLIIEWFASQDRDWVIHQSTICQQLVLSKVTVQRRLARLTDPDQNLPAWLRRTPTGGTDDHGRPSYTYVVNTAAGCSTDTGVIHNHAATGLEDNPELGYGLTTKKTKKNNNKNLLLHSSAISSQTPSDPTEPIPLAANWQPGKFHRTKIARLGVDPDEVIGAFLDRYQCADLRCTSKPRRSNWDSTFGAFITAWVEDRAEYEFRTHECVWDDRVPADEKTGS